MFRPASSRPGLVGQHRKGDHGGRQLDQGRADREQPDFAFRLRVHGYATPSRATRCPPGREREESVRYKLDQARPALLGDDAQGFIAVFPTRRSLE